jgi:16S rRNA (cytidine1402-2'-O)-methyltransferase
VACPRTGFLFLGFVPRKKGRQTFLAELIERPETCIFLESPHRLPDTLERLSAVIPDRPMVVARELSKLHEQFLRLSVAAMRGHFLEHPVRGEFVLLLEGKALESKRRRRQGNPDVDGDSEGEEDEA